MKSFLRLVLLVVLAAGAVVLWKKYRPTPPKDEVRQVSVPATPQTKIPPLDLSVRTWTNQSGRTFEGALVSAKNNEVIICRKQDAVYFQVPLANLSTKDQVFIQQQIDITQKDSSEFIESIPGLYTLSRKLDIKGYVVRIFEPSSPSGSRIDRKDPVYWFLLSKKLHGIDSGEIWVCVDPACYQAHAEGALLRNEDLKNFLNNKSEFTDSLPWTRPAVTIIEAQYGKNAKGYNVTYSLMKLASEGRLPAVIQPELFGLSPHFPESWELTVAWRTATGEVRRTLRDGSTVTWP